MRHVAIAFVALLSLAGGPARAIDPGTAAGHYASGDLKVPKLAHAVAMVVDDTEGQLDRATEMRILLTEEEAPPSALAGLFFTPAHMLARTGALHGLLIRLDPADRTGVHVTVLAKAADPSQSFTTLTLSNTEGVWTRLEANATRVVGELKPNETFDIAASFSAPVFVNPVRQDLKGAAARDSEPVKVVLARIDAMRRGDMAAFARLSTAGAMAHLAAAPPEALKRAQALAPQLIAEVKAAKRVVIREQTAAIETPDGSWMSLVREDDGWKVAD